MGRWGQLLRTFKAHELAHHVSVAVAPNAAFIVTSGGEGPFLRVWDTHKHLLQATLTITGLAPTCSVR